MKIDQSPDHDVTVRLKSVTKTFGSQPALRGIDLDVRKGSVLGLVGRNGAGKSTAIRCLVGLQRPSSGEVRLLGCDPWKMPPGMRQKVTYMPEAGITLLNATADDLIGFCAPMYPAWDTALERSMIARFGIDRHRRLKKLSLGQQRTVGLLLALCPRPEVLVLDEPAANLDAVMRREFIEEVLGLVAEQGGTVLFSSHILSDVERVADRIAFIDQGKVLLERDADALRAGIRRMRFVFTHDAPSDFRLAGMLALRRQGRELLATVEGFHEDLAAQLTQSTGAHVEAQPVGLEELFIDLVGEHRVAA